MLKKLVSLFLAVIVMMTLFTGCGSKTANDQSKANQEGSVTLRFLDVSPSPARQKYFESAFAKFKKETGITVTYESVPWDDAANKLTVLGTSHQLPDVMTTWAGWLGQFVPAGWVIPVSKYIGDTRSQYTDVINKIIWKTEEELYGDIYTVPDGLIVKGVFLRKDWCNEKGIKLDPNWTYDDYFEVVKKLTDPSKKRYGVSFRGARGGFDPILVYLQTFTGGRTYDDQGNVLFKNNPVCIEAYKKWTNLYLNGYAPKESINWGFVEMVDNFTGGLTGSLINDSEVAATCAERMKPEEWTVMPMPKSTVDGKIYNTINCPYAYTISGDSKNPDEAWKLIEFLTRPVNNIEYCKLTGLIPVKKDIANDPTYGENGPYSAFVKQLNDPNLVVPTGYGPMDITDLHQGMLHEETQKYLLGKQSAEQALTNIANELEKRMKAYLAEHKDAKVETPKSLQ